MSSLNWSSIEDARWAAAMASYAVNALWQAPLIGAAAWGVARMVRRAGPRAQHRVWVGALLLMVALPAVPRKQWRTQDGTATVSMVADDVDLSSLPPLEPMPQPWWSSEIGLAMLPRELMLALLLGYAGVAMYFAGRLGWSLWRTRLLVREAGEAEFAPEAEAAWERCREAFALGEVDRLESGELACPVTVGRATLLLPEGFAESAGREELLTALAHECAHLRRRDFWKNVGYEVASLPVVFHPAVWMVKRQIAETREMVCDGAAVERVVGAQSYVRSLLRLAEAVVGPAESPAMGMFDGRTLERRIAMMRMRRERMGWVARSGVFTAAMLAAVAVVMGGASLAVKVEAKAKPITASAAPQADAGASAAPIAGQKAETQEKAQAEKSTPPQSEDLKEHYRRIEYANSHFGYGSVAGWKTNRGQVYIEYGRPDGIDSYPSGSDNSAPYEVWHYRHVEELGDNIQIEFVDECRCGEYRAPASMSHAAATGAAIEPALWSSEQRARLQAQVAALRQRMTAGPNAEELAKLQKEVATLQEATMVRQRRTETALNAEDLARVRAQFAAMQEQMAAMQRRQVELAQQGKPVSAPGAAKAPVQIQGGVIAAMKLSGDEPVYPPIARAAHVQGTVVLHAVISKEGTVEQMNVVSGPQMLLHAAMEAVHTWRYRPYLLNGQATAVETTISVVFSLPAEGGGGNGAQSPAASGGTDAPMRVAGGVVAGNRIGGDDVQYPAEAKAAHVQGQVVLHAVISKEGRVEQMNVVSGPEMLRKAAIDAVKTWVYRPYLLNGQATAVETTVTVSFTMNGGDAPASPEMRPVSYLQARPNLPPARQAKAEQVSFSGYGFAEPKASGTERSYWAADPGAQAEHGIYRIGGDVTPPVVVRSVEPEMSAAAKAAKFAGNVLVNLVIDAQGRPQNVHVVKPVGMGLDEKAMEAVRQYQFKPALRNGQPVPVELSIEVDFQVF